jgi:cation diffusion facilitator family transporter
MVPPLERLALASMTANLALAVLKILTGALGGSFALIADGIESVADIFSSLVVWRGLQVGGRGPDADHPYGHGKAEALAGFVAAAVLLLSAGIIAWNAVGEIRTPHASPAAFTFWVLIAIIASKEGLFRWLRQAANRAHSQALAVEAWHHRADALTSLGTLTGIAVAVFGGPRFAVADDVAALLLSGIIAWNGLRLMRPAIDELMDRQVEGERLARIHAHAGAIPGIVALETVHLRRSGRYYVADLHLEVDGELSVRDGHALAHALRARLEADPALRILHVSTHVEPATEPTPPPEDGEDEEEERNPPDFGGG